jgi:hypothetical protein
MSTAATRLVFKTIIKEEIQKPFEMFRGTVLNILSYRRKLYTASLREACKNTNTLDFFVSGVCVLSTTGSLSLSAPREKESLLLVREFCILLV